MKRSRTLTSRRRGLLAAAAIGATSLVGCADWFRREPHAICPLSPEISMRDGPLLTIDSHAHVFNGSDLPVKEFFSMVAVKQDGALGAGARVLGELLENLAWSVAPDGQAELAQLDLISEQLRNCSRETAMARVDSMRKNAYSNAVQELRAAVDRSPGLKALDTRAGGAKLAPREFDPDADARREAVDFIMGLPERPQDLPTFGKQREKAAFAAVAAQGRSAIGLLQFVLQNLQYRYVSVHKYLATYNQPGTRVVDLLLPSMVDFDWWLARGKRTPTSLATQVEVMRRIAILTQGRVHGFVPYDPLRQVAFELEKTGDDSFTLVKDAVEKHGCAGVKLYPPMGFAALGNAQLPNAASFWARDWLPDWTDRPDLGELLDKAMNKLLAWCETDSIPIMAHTNLSNGVIPDFQALAGADHWRKTLAAYPELRVNFGHFGGTEVGSNGQDRSSNFADLMRAGRGRQGVFAYADAGYFVEVLSREPELLSHLRKLYEDTADKGDAALANRFLFGTDWEMTLTEGSVEAYLSQFEQLFEQLEARPVMQQQRLTDLSAKFFGRNAVDWLGLRKKDKTRDRLESFYSANRVPQSDWAVKVDRL